MTVSNLSTGMRPGVCLSSSRPTVPYEGQMIYETDTDLVYLWNGSAWIETVSALTKAPRGVVAYSISTANSGNLGSAATDIPSTTLTFTAVSGRLYKATFSGFGQQSNNSRVIIAMTDAVPTTFNSTIFGIAGAGANYFTPFDFSFVFTATGTITRKLRTSLDGGTVNFFGASADGRTYSFTIEDIGAA